MSEYIDSYKRAKIQDNWDVIVIGSGMGGQSLASIMAREGKRVLVLEQHYTAGGFTHIFKRRGYEWDVGIHYIGDVHRPYTEIAVLFDYVTGGKLKWAHMGDVYDRIWFGDNCYDYRAGKENWKAQMKEYFPDEAKAIDEYLDLVWKAQKAGRLFFAEKALPPMLGNLAGGWMRGKMLKYSNQTTLEVLQSLTNNQELIGVLAGQYGDYGLPPAQSSFVMHSMVVKHYMEGGNYPIGGSGVIVEYVADVVGEAGGMILTNALVDEIILDGKTAVGVKMEDGRELRAPVIVSNAGYLNTYKKLLKQNKGIDKGSVDDLKKVAHSASHFCLYTGFEHSTESLELEKPNYWIYPDNYDHDHNMKVYLEDQNQDFPVLYLSFPSAKDPDWDNRYPGRATIDLITLAPFEWFAKFEGSRWMKRGKEYDALKEKFSQRMLDKMYHYLPQLKGKVDHYELSSPLTTQHFCEYEKGEIYGLDHKPERFQKRYLRAHTPIKNLFLTGQDVVSAGIGGALAAGMLTASAIMKKNFSDVIRKKRSEIS